MFSYAILRTPLDPHKKINGDQFKWYEVDAINWTNFTPIFDTSFAVSVLQMSSMIAQFYHNQIMLKNEFISSLDVLHHAI